MKKWMFIIISLSLISFSCKKKIEDEAATASLETEEIAQQVGETMAAIDEAGGSSGQFAFMKSQLRTFARVTPNALEKPSLMSLIMPTAEAATCAVGQTFSGCVSNVVTRNFNNCTIGTATVSGSVTLTYYDAGVDNTCSMAVAPDQVHRNPNFTVSTPSGAVLSVTKTSTWGQSVAKVSSHLFRIDNDGINRKLTFNGATLIDITTTIPNHITVSGVARAGRTMNGGEVFTTNNLTGKTCSLVPTNVTWNGSCNCAISGSWSGSCSDGNMATVDITGCGTADITINGEGKSITFDRCY